MVLRDTFINVSVFGSVARGERDDFSDVDIVAVVKDGYGKQGDGLILDAIQSRFLETPSISWYGEAKMRSFFKTGDLFAWHLFLESRPVLGFPHLSDDFGEPRPFCDALGSIEELQGIFNGIADAVHVAPQNIKYELGICYVCFRNIAMAASWHLCSCPNFGRYSPYAITFPRFPLSREVYDALVLCRVSGQRGAPPPHISDLDFCSIFEQGSIWIDAVRRTVANDAQQNDGRSDQKLSS